MSFDELSLDEKIKNLHQSLKAEHRSLAKERTRWEKKQDQLLRKHEKEIAKINSSWEKRLDALDAKSHSSGDEVATDAESGENACNHDNVESLHQRILELESLNVELHQEVIDLKSASADDGTSDEPDLSDDTQDVRFSDISLSLLKTKHEKELSAAHAEISKLRERLESFGHRASSLVEDEASRVKNIEEELHYAKQKLEILESENQLLKEKKTDVEHEKLVQRIANSPSFVPDTDLVENLEGIELKFTLPDEKRDDDFFSKKKFSSPLEPGFNHFLDDYDPLEDGLSFFSDTLEDDVKRTNLAGDDRILSSRGELSEPFRVEISRHGEVIEDSGEKDDSNETDDVSSPETKERRRIAEILGLSVEDLVSIDPSFINIPRHNNGA